MTGVPPIERGLRKSISGNSSAIMNLESPICSSAWPIRPSGCAMRITSVAPNAFL